MSHPEHTAAPVTALSWFKSSYSDSEGAECVEIAAATETVHVRDSKDTRRPALTFPRTTWTRFLQHTER
jgi:hypothetical protein